MASLVLLLTISATGSGLSRTARPRFEPKSPAPLLVPGLCIAAVLLSTALAAPQVRRASAGNEPTVTVAVIQGNVPRLGLDFNSQRRAVLDNHVRETVQLAEDVKAGLAPQPQFVVWPENSSDIDPLTNDDAAQQIKVAAQAIGAPILVGTVLARPDWTPENPTASNTVIVWDAVSGPGERHDKQIIQQLYHVLSHVKYSQNASDDLKSKMLTDELIELANRFHRADECGKL